MKTQAWYIQRNLLLTLKLKHLYSPMSFIEYSGMRHEIAVNEIILEYSLYNPDWW